MAIMLEKLSSHRKYGWVIYLRALLISDDLASGYYYYCLPYAVWLFGFGDEFCNLESSFESSLIHLAVFPQ